MIASYVNIDSIRQGICFSNTCESVDGHKYYKHGTDARNSKVYLTCRMYSKGWPVIVHARSLEQEDEWDLNVISKAGKHNQRRANRNLYSSETILGRERKRKYAM